MAGAYTLPKFYSLSIFQKRHAAQLQGINCFFYFFLLNSGSFLEAFTFLGIIFLIVAPMKFSDFFPYFVLLIPGKFTILTHLKLHVLTFTIL